jgi:hypothetical protein
MTASFTIRATELPCWSANVVSRSWSSGSKREWIERGGGLFGDRRIMSILIDSLINHICDLGQGATQNVVDPRVAELIVRPVLSPRPQGMAPTYTWRDKSGLNWYV